MLYVSTDGFVIKITFRFKYKQNSMRKTISSCLTRYLHKTYVAKCLGSRTTSESILLSCESLRFTFSSEKQTRLLWWRGTKECLKLGKLFLFLLFDSSERRCMLTQEFSLISSSTTICQRRWFETHFRPISRDCKKRRDRRKWKTFPKNSLFPPSEMCFQESKWKRSRKFHVTKRNEHRAQHDK